MASGEKKELPVGTLDQIIASPDLGEAVVGVPKWDMSVKVRGLTRRQVIQWSEEEKGERRDAILLHYGLAAPAVTMEQAEHLVATKGDDEIRLVLEAVIELSGLGKRFRAAAES